MYKKLYNLSWDHLLEMRSHLGHKNNKLNVKLNSYIYGTRHNINIFNIEKIWKPLRYLFYSLVENIYKRNSFFLVGINHNLPMDSLIKELCPRRNETRNTLKYLHLEIEMRGSLLFKKLFLSLSQNGSFKQELIKLLQRVHLEENGVMNV